MNVARRESPLYRADRVERKLLVVVDLDSVTDNAEAIDIGGLLLGLLGHDQIDTFRYSDNGPPAGTPVMETEWSDPATIGWLVATPDAEPDQMTSHRLTHADGEHISWGAIVFGLVGAVSMMIARSNEAGAAYEADATLVLAASEIGADILVTNRPALLAARPLATPRPITVVSTAEAVPLVGLYLRSRGEYIRTKSGRFTATFNKGLFWLEAVWMHAPSGRNVLARTLMLDQARATNILGPLADIAIRRIARAFERRDSIWRLIDQPLDLDVSEDTLAALDSFLTFLMGSADALARLAHNVLQLQVKGEPASIAWQKGDWLKALKAKSADTAAIFAPRSDGHAALEILRLLRNTIHAEGLDAVAVGAGPQNPAVWVRLSTTEGPLIAAAIDQLGMRDAWGLHVGADRRFLIAVGPLVENVLLNMLNVFRRIFEELEKVLLTMTGDLPPKGAPTLNEDLLALHLQWQVGLGKPWADHVWDGKTA